MSRYFTDIFSRFFVTSIPFFEEEEEEAEEEENESRDEFINEYLKEFSKRVVANTDELLVEKLKRSIGKDISLPVHSILSLTMCQNCGGKRDLYNMVTGDVVTTNSCEYCGQQYLNGVAIYFPEADLQSFISVEGNILALEIRESQR